MLRQKTNKRAADECRAAMKDGSPKEFVGEFRPPITPAMVAMNICKGKVTIAALSGFADLAFANIHG